MFGSRFLNGGPAAILNANAIDGQKFEPDMDWLIDEPPSTDDPEDLRANLRDLGTIRPATPIIESMIASAERMLADLERERANHAA